MAAVTVNKNILGEINEDLQRYLKEQIDAGRFTNASEMVEAGLSLLVLDDGIDEEEMKEIEESEKEIAAGQALDWKQVAAEFRREFIGK